MMWWTPRRAQRCCHVADENCVLLSEVRVAGTPNLATQDDIKAAVHIRVDRFSFFPNFNLRHASCGSQGS